MFVYVQIKDTNGNILEIDSHGSLVFSFDRYYIDKSTPQVIALSDALFKHID